MASQRFSKGGSSAFLKTMKSAQRPGRRGAMAELVPLMRELELEPKTMDELAKIFPLARRLVFSLLSDGMIEEDKNASGDAVYKLTKDGKEFLERRALFT